MCCDLGLARIVKGKTCDGVAHAELLVQKLLIKGCGVWPGDAQYGFIGDDDPKLADLFLLPSSLTSVMMPSIFTIALAMGFSIGGS